MQKILMIVHAPAYGSERMLSALRPATALAGQEREVVEPVECAPEADKVITF